MKDYFNWIGCKSSIKERYIQLDAQIKNIEAGCKSSIKERYIQRIRCFIRFKWDVNHL